MKVKRLPLAVIPEKRVWQARKRYFFILTVRQGRLIGKKQTRSPPKRAV
jgi:hypothetical protein